DYAAYVRTGWAAPWPGSDLLGRLATGCLLSVLALVAGCERCEPCEQVYRGVYVWGNEVNVFQPCDNKMSFWVSASSWVQEPLLEFYRAHTSQPYETIYIEFRGMELDEVVDGFASDHDGLIRISEVLGLSLTVPEECH
ncbi:MAG: hypothetical protein PVG91_10785, partial [Gammaproteobacteria bacterium]